MMFSADRIERLEEWQLLLEYTQMLRQAYLEEMVHCDDRGRERRAGYVEVLSSVASWPQHLEQKAKEASNGQGTDAQRDEE